MNKVGIVTVTYNSGRVIDGFLRSLLRQSYADFILYMVDSGSADDTLVKSAVYHDSRIRTLRFRENIGFARGSNEGIRAAMEEGCSTLLLINNDTEFESSLLQTLVAGLNDYAVDMIAPKILFFDRPEMIWSAGGGLNPRRGYTGFHYGYAEIDRGQFDVPRLVDHAPACCLLVRKEVFERIGMLDERYFVYVEDTDFCYRASRAGLKLLYCPAATVLHKASTLTGGTQSHFTVRALARNQTYFLLKHFGIWYWLCYVAAFQLYQLARLVCRRISGAGFLLRQKGMAEGIHVWQKSRTP